MLKIRGAVRSVRLLVLRICRPYWIRMAKRVWPGRLKLVLEPGNELDAYIHENFFEECAHSLKSYNADNHDSLSDYILWRCSKCAKSFSGLYYSRYGRGTEMLCPAYSTNNKDTLKLMYELQARGRVVSVDFEPGETFSASILTRDEGGMWTVKGLVWEQPTFSIAICTALAKSMGWDK